MDGIEVTPIKIINTKGGDVLHGIKKSDKTYHGFGETYFSKVNYKSVKGWKKHTKMVSNLVVPIGEVKFIFYDDRLNSKTKGSFYEIIVSQQNYVRLTIQPGLWMAFIGLDKDLNMVANISSIEHDPEEGLVKSIDYNKIPYDFT
jgi:dTDP-4-dehydrorhamnose 3,5-epimerase